MRRSAHPWKTSALVFVPRQRHRNCRASGAADAAHPIHAFDSRRARFAARLVPSAAANAASSRLVDSSIRKAAPFPNPLIY